MVVTNASLGLLVTVGVIAQQSYDSGSSYTITELSDIAPGMKLVDDM
jgi:hypothetical protein